MSRPRPLVMAYAQDIGGARAILPVLRRFCRDPDLSVSTLAHPQALRVLIDPGISAICLDDLGYSIPLDRESARHLIERLNPDVLLASTSHPRDPSNGRLVQAARELRIRTIGILDHWKGTARFSESQEGPVDFMPDTLGMLDRTSQALYRSQGLRPEQLPIVGHPYLEEIACARESWRSQSRVSALRCRLGLDPANPVILLCSETVHDHGYHEICGNSCHTLSDVRVGGDRLIELVHRTVERLAARSGRQLTLMLRPHPNQRAESPFGVPVMDPAEVSDVEAVALATVVLGLSSMPLIEAAVMGTPTASLAFFDGWRPACTFYDDAAWEAQTFFPVLSEGDELEAWLTSALAGCVTKTLSPAYAQEFLLGATDRCVNLVRAGLGLLQVQDFSTR